jgi:YD repeat-containing protein
VITRGIKLALTLAVLVCACRLDAVAQSCESTVNCAISSFYVPYSNCAPPIPVTSRSCQATGNNSFAATCNVKNKSCAPHPDRRCPWCAGSPIDLATGDTFITETDARIPGLGGGLTLVRTWNSIWPNDLGSPLGLFGLNWRSTYEERVYPGSDGYMKYTRGDGTYWSFGYDQDANNPDGPVFAVVSPGNQTASLLQGLTSWTLTFQNGEQRVFDALSGNLTSIIDRNGNTTQLTYDSSNRLISVTDPASRHLYFSYSSPSSYLVSSVTSDVGISLSYAYDGLDRLVQVTKPDGTTVSFQYDANSFISSVLDSNGKVLESHTYDNQGEGLTSSRAGGVDAVTLSYPQPPPYIKGED